MLRCQNLAYGFWRLTPFFSGPALLGPLQEFVQEFVMCIMVYLPQGHYISCGLSDHLLLDGAELPNVDLGRDYATKNVCRLP